MPVHVIHRNGLWRVVEEDGDVAKTENGKARDGGGHADKKTADAQARAINEGVRKKK